MTEFAVTNASTGEVEQTFDSLPAEQIPEIIQRARPQVLLINEFDYVENGLAAELFQDNYLSISQNGATPIEYGHYFVAPSNTGIARA